MDIKITLTSTVFLLPSLFNSSQMIEMASKIKTLKDSSLFHVIDKIINYDGKAPVLGSVKYSFIAIHYDP